MTALEPLPIPAALAAPTPDDTWVDAMAEWCVEQDSDYSPDEAGAQLAFDTATGGADHADGLPERARRWMVTDTATAEWAMRHVAEADAELTALRVQADEWTRRIEAWFAKGAARAEATKAFMGAHLERYALDRRAANERHKTLTLPSGTVRTSATAAKVEITDAEAVVMWAEEAGLGEVVRVTKSPRVGELRDHVTIGPWWVGVRVSLVCGHTDLMADSAYPPPEPGEAYHCPQCPNGDDAYHGGPSHVQSVEVLTVLPAALHPDAPLAPGMPGALHRVPGTTVSQPAVTANVKAQRP